MIDVRTEAEVAQGVIDGAIDIPLHLLPLRAADIPQGQARGDLLPLWCPVGAGMRIHGVKGLWEHA